METNSFDGVFTEEIRHMLIEKRIHLQMSQSKLSEYLGCSRESISHWENGRATTCRPSQIIPIQNFISGKFDERWRDEKELEDLMYELTRKLSPSLRELLFKSIDICKQQNGAEHLLPRLCRVYLKGISQFLSNTRISPKNL